MIMGGFFMGLGIGVAVAFSIAAFAASMRR
jgi:hypothetical protein